MESDFQPRNRNTHKAHIESLDGPLHDYMTTTYGINFDSILNTLRYFHVTEGLVMDVMHNILEGTLEYEVKELIKYLTSEGIISLQDLNSIIYTFPYGRSDVKNKPTEISATQLSSPDHKLSQSGEQL